LRFDGTDWVVGQISGDSIIPGTIYGNNIADYSVDSRSLAPNSVLSANLGNASVHTISIQNEAVTQEKIEPGYESTLTKFLTGAPSAWNHPVSGHYFGQDAKNLYVAISADHWMQIPLEVFTGV